MGRAPEIADADGGGPTGAPSVVGSTGDDTVADLRERIDVLSAFTGGIVFEFDREGHYLRVWTGEPQLLVRPVEEILGRTVREVAGDPQDRFHDAIRDVYDTGQPTAFEYALDVQAGRRTFSCVMRCHAHANRPRTVTRLVRDVTVAKALEGKLVQAERLAALGLLAASVGHEIRQPLSYVMTSLDVLDRELEDAPMSEHARESLDKIRGGAKRIAEIAASLDLLAAQRRRTTQALDVRRPLQAAIDLCASELARYRVNRRLFDVPLMRGDEGELCQVFANLLLNAAQALRPMRETSGTITVTTDIIGQTVRVSVRDNGSGIAADHLEHIFDPFFTTREKQGGTGLGLFITRGIVEAHGGTLSVVSELGYGTTVEVTLPMDVALDTRREPVTGVRPRALDDTRQPDERREARKSGTTPDRRRLSLLIVDDEPRFVESLRLALEDKHEIDTCLKSDEALARVTKNRLQYDVVLCDLAMPVVDGVTFYERMQELGVSERFVLMTGGAFTSRAAGFVASNVCHSISKPFLLEELLKLLDEVTAPGAS